MLNAPQNRTDIRDVAIERPASGPGTAILDYKRLKSSPLYDEEYGAWYRRAGEKMYDRSSQLLGLVIENEIHPGSLTKEIFDAAIRTDPPWTSDSIMPAACLEILARRAYEPTAAREDFERIRAEHRLGDGWQDMTDARLLQIVLMGYDDPETAHGAFDELKGDGLYYDKIMNTWNEGWKTSRTGRFTSRYAMRGRRLQTELLAVLAQLRFDPEAASAVYAKLKQDPHFYDAAHGAWQEARTVTELLDILIRLEMEPPRQDAREDAQRVVPSLLDIN